MRSGGQRDAQSRSHLLHAGSDDERSGRQTGYEHLVVAVSVDYHRREFNDSDRLVACAASSPQRRLPLALRDRSRRN